MDKSIPWDESGRLETRSLKLTKEQAEAVEKLVKAEAIADQGYSFRSLNSRTGAASNGMTILSGSQRQIKELRQQLGLGEADE